MACSTENGAELSVAYLESQGDETSESDGETEPAKSFHRRFSTNKSIKSSVCTKEGFLMKQTLSFQRWRRRYFKLKGRTLYYAKDTKSTIFDEISLTDLSLAECSTKNVNHSFQVITPFRSLVLCAESRREMEEWITALKAAASKEFYDSTGDQDFLSGQHNWYATSHARPTYCNVCREALSGVTSHGLSCEVCKFKSHKRCAAKAINNCKWTTLSSVGKDIIEEDDGALAMPHQWMEGNLPVSAKCVVCDKTCGSVLRLQDWRCLWCRAMLHTACRPLYNVKCPLGPCKVSIVPPTALHSMGTDEAWEVVRPQGCSPLLVFVNSKSGDNQGVRFLRRFKQLLNPAQVFDLMNGGPGLGLRLFRHFDPFRILICSGDGSVGWVLSEIDKFHIQNQCQVGVMPLGTGNDLARVLGWGSACDDDTHLPQLLERYEKASVKMLDRWAIMTYERTLPRKVALSFEPITAFEDSVVSHLTKMLQSDQHAVVISSAKVLCETVKDFISKVGSLSSEAETEVDSMSRKCCVLKEKLTLLLSALQEEAAAAAPATNDEDSANQEDSEVSESYVAIEGIKSSTGSLVEANRPPRTRRYKPKKRSEFVQRDALMLRANSLKKALRQIIEHAERIIDDQNSQTQTRPLTSASSDRNVQNLQPSSSETALERCEDSTPFSTPRKVGCGSKFPDTKMLRRCENSCDSSPCPSPVTPSLTTNFPLLPSSPLRHRQQPKIYLPAKISQTAETTVKQIDETSSRKESRSSSSADAGISQVCLPAPSDFADDGEHQATTHAEALEEGGVSVPHEGALTTVEEPDEVEVKPILESDEPKLTGRATNGNTSPEKAVSEKSKRHSTYSVDRSQVEVRDTSPLGERFIEGSEEATDSPKGSPVRVHPVLRRLSSRSIVRSSPTSSMPATAVETEREKDKDEREKEREKEVAAKKKKMPIINPLVSLPMWPHVEGPTGGLVSKVLLANADALCAAVTPLVDLEGDSLNLPEEKCVMNSYFGIGIDAKITLDFHLKREEHPEKCRSRARNYMWYGVLGSKEWLQKTYKNLEQKVILECDGTPIPLPSLQGVVVLNIPSFMGGTNFWGGSKEDDCFIAQSFDDRVLEVVAVFGSVQMAASRIINLQHHRIAQCSSVKITILGDEGIPVQVDGEAWVQPPGIVHIIHKNRMQMLSRNRALERSLEAWQEKQLYHSNSSGKLSQAPALTEDENHVLIGFLEAITALVRHVRLLAISQPELDQDLYNLATQASVLLDKMHPGGKIIEGPSLRVHITDLVAVMRQLCQETHHFLRDKAQSLNLRPNQEEKLAASLSQVNLELRKCSEVGGLIYFVTNDESQDKRHRVPKSGGLFKLKFLRPESKSRSQGPRGDAAEGSSTNPGTTGFYSMSNIRSWGSDEVIAWLENLQLDEYKDNFLRHDIRGPELLTLDRRDLKEIGIHKLGHIKRFQQAIWDIKEAAKLQS